MKCEILVIFYFVISKVHSIHDHSQVFNLNFFRNFAEQKVHEEFSVNDDLCQQDLILFQEGLERSESWAVRFADTWAKVQAGFLSENTLNIGDFDSCVRFQHEHTSRHTSNRLFQGQHCLVPLSALPNSTLDVDRTDLSLKNL